MNGVRNFDHLPAGCSILIVSKTHIEQLPKNPSNEPAYFNVVKTSGVRASGPFTYTARTTMLMQESAGIRLERKIGIEKGPEGPIITFGESIEVVNIGGNLELRIGEGITSWNKTDSRKHTIHAIQLGPAAETIAMRVEKDTDTEDAEGNRRAGNEVDLLYIDVGEGPDLVTYGPYNIQHVDGKDQGPIAFGSLIEPPGDHGSADVEFSRPSDGRIETLDRLRDINARLLDLIPKDPVTGKQKLGVIFELMTGPGTEGMVIFPEELDMMLRNHAVAVVTKYPPLPANDLAIYNRLPQTEQEIAQLAAENGRYVQARISGTRLDDDEIEKIFSRL